MEPHETAQISPHTKPTAATWLPATPVRRPRNARIDEDMALIATVIKDRGASSSRPVVVEFTDDDGVIGRSHVTLPAGQDAQAWADVVATRQQDGSRRQEMEAAIAQCIAGTAPSDIVRVRITLPKLWQKITRRLHNGPRNNLDAETMRGLAQHVVGRATPAIVADLNAVRSNAEVDALKAEWQALLDAGVTAFDEVDEDV